MATSSTSLFPSRCAIVRVTILNYFKNCDGGERYRFESLKVISKHLEKLRLKAKCFSICMISRYDYNVEHSASVQYLRILKAHKAVDPFN